MTAQPKPRKPPTKRHNLGTKHNIGADGLNERQRRFCAEYIIDLNGAAAARRAGYSIKSARQSAQELLLNPDAVATIQKLMDERSKRTQITADTVITEVARLAFSDVRKLFDPATGAMLPPDKWADEMAAAVSAVEVEEKMAGSGEDREQIGFTKKVKLWDKPKSLEMLGRHLKLWVDRIEASGPNGGPIETKNDGVDLAHLTDEELQQLEALRHAADSRRAGR